MPEATTVTKTIANSAGIHPPVSIQPAAVAMTSSSTANSRNVFTLDRRVGLMSQTPAHQPIGKRADDDHDVAADDRGGEPDRQQALPGEHHGRHEHVELVGDGVEHRAETRHELELARDVAVGEVAQRGNQEDRQRDRVLVPHAKYAMTGTRPRRTSVIRFGRFRMRCILAQALACHPRAIIARWTPHPKGARS